MSFISTTRRLICGLGILLAIAATPAFDACGAQPDHASPRQAHATLDAYELHGNVNQQLTLELAHAIEAGHRDFVIS